MKLNSILKDGDSVYHTRAFKEKRVYNNWVNISSYECTNRCLSQCMNILTLFLTLDTYCGNFIRNIIVFKKVFEKINSF